MGILKAVLVFLRAMLILKIPWGRKTETAPELLRYGFNAGENRDVRST